MLILEAYEKQLLYILYMHLVIDLLYVAVKTAALEYHFGLKELFYL